MESSGNRTALGVSSDIAQLVGNRLRRAREAIGRSTSALSTKIKVREHYLVAIEEGQWNELPPGLNGRGLVRIYARELSVSVPELDQAANQSVMPAEQDAQAPYQMSQKRDSGLDRDVALVRNSSENSASVQRAGEPSTRTSSTLTAAQRFPKSAETPNKTEPRRQPAPQGFSKVIESTPEEEPLDVVTPDVASILGITLDVLEPASKPKLSQENATQFTASNQLIEEINPPAVDTHVIEVKSAVEPSHNVVSQSKKSKKHSKHKNDLRGQLNSSQHEEIPLVMNGALLGSESQGTVPNTVETMVSAVGGDEESSSMALKAAETDTKSTSQLSPDQPAIEHVELSTESATSFSSSVVASEELKPVLENEGIRAAETYLKTHASDEEASETEVAPVKSGQKATRWAVGLMAACVGAIIIGQVFIRTSDSTPETDVPPVADAVEKPLDVGGGETVSVQPGAENLQNASAAGSQSPPETATISELSDPSKTNTAPAEKNTSIVDIQKSRTQPEVAPAEVAKAQPMNSVSTDQKEDEATPAATAEETIAQNNAITTGASRISETSGTSVATLTLSESIDIQITADGKRVFSGKHNPGKVEVKFNKRAEIFVQDGSKAKLKYAGWDHGTLGQSGRKRRIVLNAESFAGAGN